MRKSFITLLFVLLASADLFSQDAIKGFEIALPKYKIANSLYNTIYYQDSRRGDTSMIGEVYIGVLRNIPAKYIFKTPLVVQLARTLGGLTDSTAKPGELLFQLNRFAFTETLGTRYCFLDAALYSKTGDAYKPLGLIDTFIKVVRDEDAAREINASAGKMITDLIAGSLLLQPTDTPAYSLHDVMHIDSVDMQKMPVYNTDSYKDGLYETYRSFMTQMPDKPAIVKANRDGNVSSVRVLNDTGEQVKIHPRSVYAVVYKGQPYIATHFGYYLLQKGADNHFYFTGDIRIAASRSDVGLSYIALGMVGVALTAGGSRETYIIMIDYRTGSFIHLKKIETPDE